MNSQPGGRLWLFANLRSLHRCSDVRRTQVAPHFSPHNFFPTPCSFPLKHNFPTFPVAPLFYTYPRACSWWSTKKSLPLRVESPCLAWQVPVGSVVRHPQKPALQNSNQSLACCVDSWPWSTKKSLPLRVESPCLCLAGASGFSSAPSTKACASKIKSIARLCRQLAIGAPEVIFV